MQCTPTHAALERRAALLSLVADVAELANQVRHDDRCLTLGQRAYLDMLKNACREVRVEFGEVSR